MHLKTHLAAAIAAALVFTAHAAPRWDDKALAAARAKSAERRIAHAKLKQHMRDTAVPIRPQPDDPK